MKNKRFDSYLLAAGIALVVFLVYLPTLHNGFINWDDDLYILNNTHIRSMNAAFFKWIFTDFYAAYWAPVTWISHALDYAVWGLNPFGHHLMNNILHAVNAFFVVLLVMKLLEAWNIRRVEGEKPGLFSRKMLLIAGGVTGILFVLHPLHVESAAWVAERKDLLCALFYVTSVMQYTAYVIALRAAASQNKKIIHITSSRYIAAVGLFILALCSKPMAVSLPIVLLILDWYPFKRIDSPAALRAVLVEKVPFVVLSFIMSLIIFSAHHAQAAMASLGAIPVSTRLLVAADSLIKYLVKMAAPVHLIPYYPYPAGVSFFSLQYFPAVLLAAGITVGAVFLAIKRRRLWLSVWVYFVVTLLPVLGIVQVGPQSMADRFTYLPSLGPFLLIGIMSAVMWEKTGRSLKGGHSIKTTGIAVAVLVCVILAFLTRRQIQIWKDGVELWSAVIAQEPVRAYIAYNNRGVCYEERGQFDKAAEDYKTTIALHPSDDQAYFNLGVLYQKANLVKEAIDYYDRSLAFNPQRAEAFHNRGVLYSGRNEFARALDDFNKAIALNGRLGIAYFNRGSLYGKLGKNELARSDYQKACSLGYEEACRPQ
jgi:Tfp pilus assembly protein PilF